MTKSALLNKSSSLLLNNLKLMVHLGVTASERKKKQRVLLSLNLTFAHPPAACLTDEIADAICYDTLAKSIRLHVGATKFQLVEHLAQTIYTHIKSQLTDKSAVIVTITKFPKVAGLMGGVTFNYGDRALSIIN